MTTDHGQLTTDQRNQHPFCCRCKEEFTVCDSMPWQMGLLRKLKRAPQRIQQQFSEWLDSEIHGEGYLCGNCFFDLTDDD